VYRIKKLNSISNVIYNYLPEDKYLVTDEGDKYDAIIVRSADCHELSFPEKLLAIARAGAGVNNIPIDQCSQKGIVVFNTPSANANGVKELVLAGMLIASRNLVPAVEWTKTLKGKGSDVMPLVEKGKKPFVGPELKGKTLGVIGLGAIGVMVANSAHALDMNVIGYDPYISIENAWGLSRSVERAVTLDALLQNSDYISVHIPLLDKTKNFLSASEFSKMKKGVILLNFARNGLVDYEALTEGMENGTVAKYVTDFPNDLLLGYEKVIAIPHLGASTPESEENCAHMAAKQLKDYIETGTIVNSVNMPECIVPPSESYRIAAIHKNTPNMVGRMTAILAERNINIADMINKSRGELAYTVFNLDEAVNAETVEKLSQIEGMIRIRVFS
jgi:D-3-phosphoglycerate dehydrogenase